MEQLPRFFNLRNVIISETLPPCSVRVGAIMCISKPVYVYVRALRAWVYAYPLEFSPKVHGFLVVIECECQHDDTTTHTHKIHTHTEAHTRQHHGNRHRVVCECDEEHTKFNSSVFGRTI